MASDEKVVRRARAADFRTNKGRRVFMGFLEGREACHIRRNRRLRSVIPTRESLSSHGRGAARGYTPARMQPKLKRSELDHLADFYSLDEPRIESMLQIAGARPSRAEGREFLGHCLRIAGV